MRKKRILFCTESTFLNTGYATYSREILSYLHNTGKYEIAELGAYGHMNDPRSANIPWKFYGVIPHPNDEGNMKKYKSNALGQFGGFSFEPVCLDFRPDIVCDIRDFWMVDFIDKSPYRKFFKWILMPTVDAAPQAREWIDMYARADACLSYSNWSGEVLKKQSANRINYLGSSPPSAHPAYQPIQNKKELKKHFGIDENAKIIGTVMRNQRRKLYPDLFKAFRKFLDRVDNPEEYILYCHTCFPDAGWNIPELLIENNISSQVMFTYVCKDTGRHFPAQFSGSKISSPFSGKFNASMSNVKDGLSYEALAQVVNLFDLYVQYANCEGFGLPQVEAAACGIPVAATNYSAMESVMEQLEGMPIEPKALYKEMETGCNRAVPDNNKACDVFFNFFNLSEKERLSIGERTRQNFLKHFQWDKSGKVWEDYFDSVEVQPTELTWESKPQIYQPADLTDEIKDKSIKEIVYWLFTEVSHEPERLQSYYAAELMESLHYGYRTSQIVGSYFNEDDSMVSMGKKIEQAIMDVKFAYDECKHRRMHLNAWEERRGKVLNK